jgi:Rrf2 family protein
MPIIRRDRALTAITIMLQIAFRAGRASTVSAADLAETLGLARRGMEPLLQALSRAGLLESARGPRGGYRLARPPRDIRLSAIVAVLAPDEDEAAQAAAGPGGELRRLVIDPLWGELDAAVGRKLETLTLDDLLRRAVAAGLRRPPAEPITYAI